MDRESKYKARKQIEALKKNPPRVTKAHLDEARKSAEREKRRQEKIDDDIRKEVSDIAKDIGSYTYGVMTGCENSGVRKFHGFGDGKVKGLKCAFCGEHCSDVWHYIDGKWYGSEHKQFAGLPAEERERLCLSLKVTK